MTLVDAEQFGYETYVGRFSLSKKMLQPQLLELPSGGKITPLI
jgi:hypothetical protein